MQGALEEPAGLLARPAVPNLLPEKTVTAVADRLAGHQVRAERHRARQVQADLGGAHQQRAARAQAVQRPFPLLLDGAPGPGRLGSVRLQGQARAEE